MLPDELREARASLALASNTEKPRALSALIAAVRAESADELARLKAELDEAKDRLADMEGEKEAAAGERDAALAALLRARPVAAKRKVVSMQVANAGGAVDTSLFLYLLLDDGTVWHRDAWQQGPWILEALPPESSGGAE